MLFKKLWSLAALTVAVTAASDGSYLLLHKILQYKEEHGIAKRQTPSSSTVAPSPTTSSLPLLKLPYGTWQAKSYDAVNDVRDSPGLDITDMTRYTPSRTFDLLLHQ